MTISQSNIIFTLSGGSTNTKASQSLGDEPSVYPILNKRLFNDVSKRNAKTGVVDYRCCYICNTSSVDSFYEPELTISYTVPGDITVQLGFDFQDDEQILTVRDATSVTSGTFTLNYFGLDDYTAVVSWDASLSIWAENMQTALRDIVHLEDVTVSGELSGNDAVFTINFTGTAGNRYHNILVVTDNDLSPESVVAVSKSNNGGPINRVAGIIDVGTTSPTGIVFSLGTAYFSDFLPQDFVPVWVQRVVPANTPAMENDGFTFQISGATSA